MVLGWAWSQDAAQTSSLCGLLMYNLEPVTQCLNFFIWKVEMSLYFPRWRRNEMWWYSMTILLMQVKNGQILAISRGSTCAWKVLNAVPAGGQGSLNLQAILSPFHRLGYNGGKWGSRGCRKAWGPTRGAKADWDEKPQNGAEGSGNTALPKVGPRLPFVILKPPPDIPHTHTYPGPSWPH